MKKLGYTLLSAGLGLLGLAVIASMSLLVACGGGEAPVAQANDGVGMFSDDAAICVADIRRQMKSGSEAAQPHILTEAELYQPQAVITMEVVASGAYTLTELTNKATELVNRADAEPYAACLVMAGLTDAIQATAREDAVDKILGDFEGLADLMADHEIPTVFCEILPIVSDYAKPSYGMAPSDINGLIDDVDKGLYSLALDKATGFVFAARVLGPRVGTGKGSILLNEANSGNMNGVQPNIEGMRLLCQLYAYGLTKCGYRGGRILVLGDTRVADEALPRKIDHIEFLLPKYLEIELDKTCP